MGSQPTSLTADPGGRGDLAPGHGAAQNTLFSLLIQGISAVFTAGLTLFLLRSLGPETYGILALAISAGTIALLVSDFGIPTSLARYVAEQPNDRARTIALLRTALTLKVIASTVMAVGLIALAPLIANAYGTPELTLPIQLVSVGVAAQSIGGLFLGLFVALGRISINIRYAVVESTVETGASIGLVLLGAGAAGAAAGRAIGFAVAGILIAALAIRIVGWKPPAGQHQRSRIPAKIIAGYGATLTVVNSIFAILDRIDILIIGAFLGPASAGIFEAAVRIATFLQYPGIAVSEGFAPRLALRAAATEHAHRFLISLRYTTLFYLFLAAPLVVWAHPIIELALGEDYSESATVLQALTPAIVLLGIAQVLAGGVDYLGRARKRIPVAVLALTVNVVIDLLLIPMIGILGGAVGSGVALTIYVGGHVRIHHHATALNFAGLLPTITRGLVAALVASTVFLYCGTESLTWLDFVLAPPIALAAFLATLLATREIGWGDLRGLLRIGFPRGRVA